MVFRLLWRVGASWWTVTKRVSVDDCMRSVVDGESVVGGVVMMWDVEMTHEMCRDGRVVKALD